jgi:cobalt-precorrin 5A hydrolase
LKSEISNNKCQTQRNNFQLAVWALTTRGADLAEKITAGLPDTDMHCSSNLPRPPATCYTFESLSEAVSRTFHRYDGHIFIMATGIVVRVTAPHLEHKMRDPAVVVVDEMGQHAISLLSGHIGGANALAKTVAGLIGATPVITTATDIHNVPAIDVIAKEKNLKIENPKAVKGVSMALMDQKKVYCHDPFGLLENHILKSNHITGKIPSSAIRSHRILDKSSQNLELERDPNTPGVFIDDILVDLPSQMLILRPRSLVAGIGCNRNTGKEEIKSVLQDVLDRFGLASASLNCIATIDIKKNEPGLIALAADLDLPIIFFTSQDLNHVQGIQTPSAVVKKHTGARSVCEAAAILGANHGNLIVSKQVTRNVTVAIARINFTS